MKRFEFHYVGKKVWKTADEVVAAASQDLKKEDYLDRRFAIAALCQLSSHPAAQTATADVALALSDEDVGVRYWAANTLIGLSNAEGSDITAHHKVVATAFKDKDPGVRCYAAVAMVRIAAVETESAVPYMKDFVAALKDSDPQVRIEATKLLVEILDVEDLAETAASHVEALKDRRQPMFRASAAEALGLLGGAGLPHIPELIIALEDKYAKVRAAAAKALGCLGIEALRQTSPLLVGLVNSDMDADVRNAAAQALDMVDLAEGLQHNDPELRAWAAERAVSSGGKVLQLHITRFGEMLKDTYGKVRSRVATALGDLGDLAREYVPDLLENALADPDGDSRVAATKALVKIEPRALRESDPPSYETMSTFLKHDDAVIRKSAAECLGAMGSDAKSEGISLDAALCDEDASVRLAVVKALFNMGKSGVRTAGVNLGKAAKTDTCFDVRKMAAFALYEFNLAIRFGLPPK